MANTTIPVELSSTPGIVDNSNATAITIDSSENVGIGTSSPDSKLHVDSGVTSTSDWGNIGIISDFPINNTGRIYGSYMLQDSESIKAAGVGFGYDGTGYKMYFGTAATISSGVATQMTIDRSGNVGIGTASPSAKLHVDNGSGSALYVGLANNIYSRGAEHIWQSLNNASEYMRIDSSGNVLVGKSTTTYNTEGCNFVAGGHITKNLANAFNFNRTGNSGAVVSFQQAGGTVGSISVTGSTTAYNTSSDYRLKENVVTDWDATTRLKQLKPSRFNFIADADTTVDGFLAHEVQEIVPEAIAGTKDAMRDEEYEVTAAVLDDDGNVVTEAVMGTRSVPDYQGIDQSKLVPLLVKTIQELEARITTLENA